MSIEVLIFGQMGKYTLDILLFWSSNSHLSENECGRNMTKWKPRDAIYNLWRAKQSKAKNLTKYTG